VFARGLLPLSLQLLLLFTAMRLALRETTLIFRICLTLKGALPQHVLLMLLPSSLLLFPQMQLSRASHSLLVLKLAQASFIAPAFGLLDGPLFSLGLLVKLRLLSLELLLLAARRLFLPPSLLVKLTAPGQVLRLPLLVLLMVQGFILSFFQLLLTARCLLLHFSLLVQPVALSFVLSLLLQLLLAACGFFLRSFLLVQLTALRLVLHFLLL